MAWLTGILTTPSAKVRQVVAAILAGGVLFLGSCSSDSERARRELQRRSIPIAADSLRDAVESDDPDLVGLLFLAGLEPEEALIPAASRDRCRALAQILEGGAEVGSLAGSRALALARQRGHDCSVGLLRAAGASIDARNNAGETLLWRMARRDSRRRVRNLLAQGADPNSAAVTGVTPLMLAAAAGLNDNITLLLNAGAVTRSADRDGWRALDYAAAREHDQTVARLLAAGADANTTTELGWTPLMWAARHGRLESVVALLAAGAEVNRTSKAGRSALTQAVVGGHLATVEALLVAGADPVLTVDGINALDWARISGHQDIERLLVPAGVPE